VAFEAVFDEHRADAVFEEVQLILSELCWFLGDGRECCEEGGMDDEHRRCGLAEDMPQQEVERHLRLASGEKPWELTVL
jgi:hypothetical protein